MAHPDLHTPGPDGERFRIAIRMARELSYADGVKLMRSIVRSALKVDWAGEGDAPDLQVPADLPHHELPPTGNLTEIPHDNSDGSLIALPGWTSRVSQSPDPWAPIRDRMVSAAARNLKPLVPWMAPQRDQRRVIARHLMAMGLFTWFYQWRLLSVATSNLDSIWSCVRIEGLEGLEQHRSSGRPVILINSHFGGGRTVPVLLARMDIPVHSIAFTDRFRKLGAAPPDGLTILETENAFLPRVAFAAQNALRKGAVLHLAADGYFGGQGVALPFCGRRRSFITGFVELAANTNALILPVFAPLDEQGNMKVELLCPLDRGPKEKDRVNQAKEILRQYVELLETRWRHDPGNVLGLHIQKYQELPIWTASTP